MVSLLWPAISSALAQDITVGIKAGVPLSGLLRTNSRDARSYGEFPTQTKRYTIGPVVDIALPLGFGLEFGAMYKRFDQQSVAVTTTGFTTGDETGYPIQQIEGIFAEGHSWEFPVAVQYRFLKSNIRPYVEGGLSLNRLSNVYTLQTASTSPRQLPITTVPLRGSFTRVGRLFGVGLDLKVHRLHVTPGLRYARYSKLLGSLTACISGAGCPSNNAVDFLVGFTF